MFSCPTTFQLGKWLSLCLAVAKRVFGPLFGHATHNPFWRDCSSGLKCERERDELFDSTSVAVLEHLTMVGDKRLVFGTGSAGVWGFLGWSFCDLYCAEGPVSMFRVGQCNRSHHLVCLDMFRVFALHASDILAWHAHAHDKILARLPYGVHCIHSIIDLCVRTGSLWQINCAHRSGKSLAPFSW